MARPANTLSALSADRVGARTLTITNTLGSTVTREAYDTVFIRAGPEIDVAITKMFCSQVATMALVAIHIGRQRDAISSSEVWGLLEGVRGSPVRFSRCWTLRRTFVRLPRRTPTATRSFSSVGRLGAPVALEGALKPKEISYDHAEGLPASELKHGLLALVTPETPMLAVPTEGSTPEETLNNVKEAESRGAPVLGAVSGAVADAEKFVDKVFEVPELGDGAAGSKRLLPAVQLLRGRFEGAVDR